MAIAAFDADSAGLKAEMKELREKIDRLRAGQGTCPLCGTELGVDRCQHIITDYELQGQERKQRYLRNQEELARHKREQDSLRNEVHTAESKLDGEIRALERRIGMLEREGERIQQVGRELPLLQQKLTDVRELLSRQTFAEADRRQLQQVQKELALLGYDASAHQHIRQKVEELRPFEARHRESEQAERLLPEEQANLASIDLS